MIRRRRVIPLVGLLASLVLVWSATAGILWNANAPQAVQDARFSAAERLVFFRVDADRTLRMQLPAGAESIRLVTHLVLPEGTTYEADRQFLYGLRARLIDEAGVVQMERPLFTRTRQSKAELVNGTWLKEAAFSTQANVQLTDEREFFFDPPLETRHKTGTLELHYPGPAGALLVRAYARIERADSIFPTREAARVRRAEERAEKATYEPWEKLSYETQQSLVSERWQRLDALGEPGQDFLTEAVHHTPFRLPFVEVAHAEQERLQARRAVAVNVTGPTRLALWLWKPADVHSGQVQVSTLSVLGEEQSYDITVSTPEPQRQWIDVPAGAHTVAIRNASDADLRFTVEGPRYAWLAPETLKGDSQGAQIAFTPDVRRVDSHVVGPSCEGVELELGEPLADGTRLVRIDARVLQRTGDLAPSAIALTLLDARGAPIGQTRFDAPYLEAPFEAADLPLGARGRIPCATAGDPVPASTVEITDRPVAVGEPVSARVFLPAHARKLVVRASRPTAINLSSFLPSQDGAVVAEPYSQQELVQTRWRNAPVDQASWHPLRPSNHRRLLAAGATISLLTQVRLDRIGENVIGPRFGDAVSLFPLGTPPTRELLEPDARALADTAAKDPLRALYTRLVPNRAVRTRFEGRTPTRPELRLELDPSALGKTVQVLVDGTPVRRIKLRTTRIRELLPPVKPGTHEIVLRSNVDGIWGTLNRPPATNDSDALRLRTVYRVSEGLRVNVRKKSAAPVTVNIVVYTPHQEASEAPRLSVSIDGGKPKRNLGMLVSRLTRATRALPLPATEREGATPMGDPRARWYPHTVAVTLGEDLAPGVHQLRISPLGEGTMWARFFMYDGDETLSGPKQWTRPGWDQEDAP